MVEIKQDKCKGCELCVSFCPSQCLELSHELNHKGVRFAKIKQETNCTNCGFCFLVCPDNCVRINYNVESEEQRVESIGQRA